MKNHVAENNLTSQVSTEVSKLTSMLKKLSRLNHDMRTYKSGSFKFNTLSMLKNSKNVYPLTMADLNESEVEYVQNLEKQFGFSEWEALLILSKEKKKLKEYWV